MGVYVIEDSIFDELNRSSESIAGKVRKYFDGGHELWVTRGTYERLKRIPANAQLAASLRLKVPPSDPPTPRDRRGMHASHIVEAASNLAMDKKGTLVTMNEQAAKLHRGLGGKIDDSSDYAVSKRPVDYNRTRQLLGLRPERFTPNGNIVPQADRRKNPEPQPNLVIKENGADRKYVPGVKGPTTARTGSPIQPVTEGSLNPTPKTNVVAKLGLRGINWVVNAINDHIQKERLEEAWNKIRPVIEGTLNAELSLGALVRFHSSRRKKMGAENETPLTHTASFEYIDYEYGLTREEANSKFRSRHTIKEAKPDEQYREKEMQEQWIPPIQPVSPAELPTPYPRAGLCTFVPGREQLLKVQFSHAMGIDEKMKSLLTLKAGHDGSARFIVMFPPSEFKYMWNGAPRKEELELSLTRPAEVVDHELKAVYLPTLDLDSWINPYDGKTAMVYPADVRTEGLFKQGGRIDDSDARLVFEKMDSVRFVRPQDIRLLKYFGPTLSS